MAGKKVRRDGAETPRRVDGPKEKRTIVMSTEASELLDVFTACRRRRVGEVVEGLILSYCRLSPRDRARFGGGGEGAETAGEGSEPSKIFTETS
jgi:hypothetical protein